MKIQDYIALCEAYKEQEGSCFTHNGNLYSLNKLLEGAETLPQQNIPVDEMKWILAYDRPDPKRMAEANVDAPILVTMFEGKLTVLDGLHRLALAVQKSIPTLRGHMVDASLLESCRLAVESSHVWFNPEKDAYFRMEKLSESTLEEKSAIGSAWVVIECDETGDILLGKRAKSANNAGQWNLFGGGIEAGENALQTALRELWEEAGMRVEASALTRVGTSPMGMTIFALSLPRNRVSKMVRINKKEIEKVKWFSPDAFPDNLHKSARGLIQAMQANDHIGSAMADPSQTRGGAPSMRGMMEAMEMASSVRELQCNPMDIFDQVIEMREHTGEIIDINDEDVARQALHELEVAQKELREYVLNGYIKVYRAMTVSPEWLQKLQPGETIGECWSFDIRGAFSYGGGEGLNVIFSGVVHANEVDWITSLAVHCSGEAEIRVVVDADVKVEKIATKPQRNGGTSNLAPAREDLWGEIFRA